MRSKVVLILFCMMYFTACVPSQPQIQQSALQTREVQTRNFSVRDQQLVMKAVLNALQDEGYIAKNAVVELGLLTATKESNEEDQTGMIVGSILQGHNARWKKTLIIEANANISKHGKETRLRISFQRKFLDNAGGIMHVESIKDPYFYQRFFAKVDQSIFYQTQQI